MLKKILPILLALSVLLTACGTPAAPTMAPADVQNTAVAAAWTMVQATLNAQPTATQLPPTETPSPTPLPTFTPPPVIPTLEQLILPTATTAAAASDPNNCIKPLNMGEAGPTKNERIENTTKSQVNLSLNLYKPNLFGQCGALSYVVKPGEKRKIAIPSGYWYGFAYILKPAAQVDRSWYIGPSATQDLLRIVIKQDALAWVGP